MATDILTATTPEELAEQFPCTARPFAVWYNSNPEADHRKWAVNGMDGEAVEDFEDMATALKVAAEMGKEWDKEARNQKMALDKVNNAEEKTDLPPNTLEHSNTLEHFYDLRALAMTASAMTFQADEGSDELNAVRRVLQCLCEKALQFANEADEFFIASFHQKREV